MRDCEPIFPGPPYSAAEHPNELEGRLPRSAEDEALLALHEIANGGRLYSFDEVFPHQSHQEAVE